MQVGIQSFNRFDSTSARSLGEVSRTGDVSQINRNAGVRNQGFPDSPFISTQPLRYNVQLNEQLTSVQQADNFLRKVENHLLVLRQSAGSAGSVNSPKFQKSVESLSALMDRRSEYSGNTVDRQLKAVLGENQPQVNFSLQGIGNVLQKSEQETLIFSLAGTKREITAVTIKEDSFPQQVLRSLNLGLGKFGIQGKTGENNQVVFSVNENQWERISEHLSVRGEGQRYPDGVFYPLKAVAEASPKEVIDKIKENPTVAKSQLDDVQNILEQVNGQRRQLMRIKDNVRSRIDSMATFQGAGSALQASAILASKMSDGKNDFKTVSQALGGQANVHKLTVRNLLG